MRRVTLVTEYFVPHAPGGAEWSTLALARQLASRGLHTSIITLDLADERTAAEAHRVDADLAEQDVFVHRLPFRKKMHGAPNVFPSYVFGNPWTERVLARRLVRALRRIAPDVVHVQGLGMLVPAQRAARRLGLPLALTVRDYRALCPAGICLHSQDLPAAHDTRADFRRCADEYLRTYEPGMPAAARLRYRVRRELEWSTRTRQKRVFDDLDAAVFVSDAVRRIYAAGGLAARENVVVHNLPPDSAGGSDPETLRRRFDLDGPVVLFVGRWSLGKGAEELSRAWTHVRGTQPDARLVIVGRREASNVAEHDGMVFTGPLPHDDVLGLMRLARLFVLPSRWPEPYARTALEAFAAGTPVIATRAGGNAEVVADGETGLLVPRGDVDALAAAVTRLLDDPALAERLGDEGRRRQNASGADPLGGLIALYDRLTGERPLRICAPVTSVTEKSTLGGGVFHFHNLRALAERGVECVIPLAFRLDHEPRPGWDVRVIPIRRTFKFGALLSNLVFGVAVCWQHLVRRGRFDLVRVGDLYHMGPGVVAAARLCGKPTVGVIHHIDHERRFENAIVGWTARRLDGVLVPSQATADDVRRTFGVDVLALHRIVEGPNAVADSGIDAAEAKKHFALGGKQVIGFVGALQPRKNVGFLLEVFAKVAANRPRACLLLVGDGVDRDALTRRAAALGIGDRVVFAGRLLQQEKAQALRAMDVFAFPSLNEGFGLAVVEAMAEGVPPVVSDHGSLPEVVVDGETGFVRPVDDPSQFAAAIEDLLGDAALRRRIGTAARTYVQREFTWEKCAAQTEAAMRATLRQWRGRALGVVLNSGDSLAAMEREGQTGRFVDHYLRRYADAFDRVHVFGYGDDRAQPYPNAVFVPSRPGWKGPLYAALMPLVHPRAFAQARLLRVMQTGGALPAIVAHLLWGTRFVTTYGYLYGDFMRVKGRRLYGAYLDVLERVALRLAERVIVTTPALLAHVTKHVAADKIVMLPNGVDLAQFRPGKTTRRKGKRVVLFVGRITAQKNLPLLVEALTPLRDRVKLVVAGTGEGEAALLEQAAAVDLDIELRGVVPHAQLPALHREADVFVLPSKIEGHPKALVEALASGLPCVGTDAPGIRDVIRDGENGLLVAPVAEALRAAIARVLDEPALAKKLAAGARRAAEEHYDLDALLTRELALLTALVEGR